MLNILSVVKKHVIFIHWQNVWVHCIDVVMVSVLASSLADRGFEPRSGQPKDYKIGICCFSAKHLAFRRKSKDRLARNQENVSDGATCLSADCYFSELSTVGKKYGHHGYSWFFHFLYKSADQYWHLRACCLLLKWLLIFQEF